MKVRQTQDQTTMSQKGVRYQKCETPCGPFGFWYLTPFRSVKRNALRYRWLICSLSLSLLVGTLTGCGDNSDPAQDSVSPGPGDTPGETESTGTQNTVVTITDRLDRPFEAGNKIDRIVSLSPASTELLFALGLGPKLVGATKHCNFPPEALDVPRVGGGTLESISVEALVAAKPDLVLTKWDTHQALIETLDRMQIPSLAIGAQSLDELFEETRWLGAITGRQDQAESLIHKMASRRDHLVNLVQQVRPSPPMKVFYEVWDDPLMSAGPDSFIDEMLTLAGLDNIVKDTAIRYPRISAETVLKADPDMILAPTTHFEMVDVQSIAKRPGWSSIAAVTNNRIHLISGDEVSRCGPRLLDALTEIILAAYPEIDAVEARF